MATPLKAAINTRMGALEWSLLLGLAALWGGSFFFVEIIVVALPPLTTVLLRVGLAALALGLIVRLGPHAMPRDSRSWRQFAVMGFLNNAVPFSLIVYGQVYIEGGLASILNALTPLFAVGVAHLFLIDERLDARRAAGVAIGFAGAVVLIGPAALGDVGSELVAQLAVIGAAVSYAFAGVYGRRFRRQGQAPIVTATGQVTMSTLLLLPLGVFVDRPWTLAMPGVGVWLAVLALALACTALAYIMYFRILATAGAVNLMLVTLLVPVTAIALGAIWLGERLTAAQLTGLGVIALGLVVLDGRLLNRVRGTGART